MMRKPPIAARSRPVPTASFSCCVTKYPLTFPRSKETDHGVIAVARWGPLMSGPLAESGAADDSGLPIAHANIIFAQEEGVLAAFVENCKREWHSSPGFNLCCQPRSRLRLDRTALQALPALPASVYPSRRGRASRACGPRPSRTRCQSPILSVLLPGSSISAGFAKFRSPGRSGYRAKPARNGPRPLVCLSSSAVLAGAATATTSRVPAPEALSGLCLTASKYRLPRVEAVDCVLGILDLDVPGHHIDLLEIDVDEFALGLHGLGRHFAHDLEIIVGSPVCQDPAIIIFQQIAE